jgi:hypothetical protein
MLLLTYSTAQCHNPENHSITVETDNKYYHDYCSFWSLFLKKSHREPKNIISHSTWQATTGVTVVTVLEKPATVFISMHMITFVPLVNVQHGEGKKMLGVVMGQLQVT